MFRWVEEIVQGSKTISGWVFSKKNPQKAVGGMGGCTPSAEKIRKIVFDRLPYSSSKFDTLFVPDCNCDLKCRWRGWRCTTTRSTRSTRTPSTVWPSRWQGTSRPSLLSFLLRFNLGLTTSLLHWTGTGPMEKLQTYRVSQKNFKFVWGVGDGVRTKREALTLSHPSNKSKAKFFGTPCTTLLFAIHAIQLSVPHHTLLLFHFWQLFDLQKYFPLEVPLLSVILQTLRTSHC